MSTRDRLTPGSDVDVESVDAPRRLAPGKRNLTHAQAGGSFGAAPGKLTLTRHLTGEPVAVPYQSELEAAFGVSLADVEAYVGEAEGLGILGAHAAAEANVIAFAADAPALAVVAHEIAHVLQAQRSSGRGDPEEEADRIEAQVAAGQKPQAVMATASGLLHKDEPEVDPNALPPLTEDELHLLEFNLALELPYLLNAIKALPEGPFGNYIKADGIDFWALVVNQLKPICGPAFVAAMAPDKVPKLTDMAARRGWQEILDWEHGKQVTKKEPGSFYEDNALLWDIANAIARRWADSIQRVLPRWVKIALNEVTVIDDKGKEHKELRQSSADAESINLSHPFDRVVANALGGKGVEVDGLKFKQDHPDLVEQAVILFPRTVPVTFPAERGLFHWAEAPADATAEEVALALFGKTDQAFRLIPMAPLWGFRRDAVDDFKSEKQSELHKLAVKYGQGVALNQAEVDAANKTIDEAMLRENAPGGTQDFHDLPGGVSAPDLQWGLSKADIDPMAELSASQGGAQLAADRAKVAMAKDKKEVGKKHDELAIYDRLKENTLLLDQIEPIFTNFNRWDGGVMSRAAAIRNRLDQTKDTCVDDPEGWYALANEQNKVLSRIARGAGECRLQLVMFGGVNKTDDGQTLPDPSKLPEFTRKPIVDTVNAFHDALVAIDFPEEASARADKADELLRNLTIAVMEGGLKEANPIIINALTTQDDRHKDTAKYDPKEMEDRSKGLYSMLGRLRIQMASNPAEGQKQLADVQGKVSDLQFEVAIVANLEALDAVWAPLHASHDFWQDLPDWAITSGLEEQNRRYYERFKTDVFDPFKTGDPDKKKQAKEAFTALSKEDDFAKHFERVKTALENDAKHKKWAKIIVAIAIAVVAFGLGQWAGAAMALEGMELAIVASTVELGANVALNKLIFNENPTVVGLVTGFLFNVGMFAVMARAARIGKAAGMAAELETGTVAAAAETSKLAKAGQKVWQITKEGIFANVLGMVQMEVQTLVEKGRLLKRDELEELFINNTVQWIGFSVGTRAVDPLLPPHARHGKANGIDIEGLMKEREAITKMAAEAEKTRDPELGKQLVERERAYLEREQKVREQLIELAKKKPELFKAGETEQLRMNGQDDPHMVEMRQAQALLGLEEIGPGLYRADGPALDAVLHQHKASDGKVVGVETDPHSGLRTVSIQPPDGPLIKVKEKLGEGDKRGAPLGSPQEAIAFESWLATAELHKTDPQMSEGYRERLREYYARDPDGAVRLAKERYEYPGSGQSAPDPSPVAHQGEPPKPPALEAEAGKAFEQWRYQKEGDPKVSNPGETPMNRGDFEAMYKAGFEYDPVRRDWVSKGGVKAGTTGAPHTPAGGNADAMFVGHIHSEAVGVAVLQKLAYGEVEALRVAGVEPQEGLNSQAVEWGLMKNPKDGSFILVRGGKGAVDFAAFPGFEPVGHTHPLYDPHPTNGVYQKRELQGKNGDGVLDATNLAGTATYTDLVYLVPSTGDLGYLSLSGLSHRVKTPFVHLGDGKIGNPTPGMVADGIDFLISNPKPIGVTKDAKQFVVFEADIIIMAGDTPLHSQKLYQYYADYGTMKADNPSFTPPAYDPLPPNHPLARLPEIARTGHTPIGNVTPSTLNHLEALKIIGPDASPAMQAMKPKIERLLAEIGKTPEAAAELAAMAAHQTLGNASGLEGWFEWAAELNKSGKDLTNTLADFRQANRLLGEEPGSTVKLGGDANPDHKMNPATGKRWDPTDPSAQKAKSFDLERTRADGTVESIEVTRYNPKRKADPPSASDVTEGLAHAVEKLQDRQANGLPVGTRIVAVVELPLPFEANLRGGGKRKISATGDKTLEVNSLISPSNPTGAKAEGNLFTDKTGEGVLPALAAKADNQLVHEVQVTDYSGTVLVTYVRDPLTNAWSIK